MDDSLKFVSVATPGGSKQVKFAPFGESTAKPEKKRKADALESSTVSSSNSTPMATWKPNLTRRGGFWGDAYWYDLQLERRLPLAKEMLKQLVLALPPCANLNVLDLCAGSGRVSAAVLGAYPTTNLILLDSSDQRLKMAAQRLDAGLAGASKTTKFVTQAVTPGDTTEFVSDPVDLVVACLAFHVLTEQPAHYGQGDVEHKMSGEDMYDQLFRATWRSLRPGGHVVFGDHVGQLPLFKQLKALERAGFVDVDCAWRQDDSFVAGGRKPTA